MLTEGWLCAGPTTMDTLLYIANTFHRELLSLLDIKALAALACTCKELRGLAYSLPASAWEAAAR